jgi:uncharacterized protein YggE
MYLKKIMPVFMLALFLAMPFTQAKEANEPATITVQGSGKLDVAPDIAYIQLAVVSEGATVGAAQKENAAIANRVYSRLEAAGIAKDYIKTTQYSVVPLYQQENAEKNNGVPVIRGYQIINGFNIAVAPERAGEIIDLALQAGVNQVQTIRFGRIDEAGAKNVVLQMAVRDALGKAEAVAAALGKRIGRVQTVNESGVYVQMPEFDRLSKAAYSVDTPISSGYVQLNANVQLVVEIE